ncbi:type IV pili methyl-accepting chemotaxis transducer N-terminal domain-containing protein [Inhella sp. 4Y17]|uniref:Sensor protein n=2 Tax=Inhella gelatinilytica TaxID=2795030 RepID=A0A931ITW3_9BURK|nr:type IV pili methyl-accepting chemotaxis transducer N-terminal domain-containing protein [Inhella gelatinilytica]
MLIGVSLLVMALVSIGLTLWVSWQLEGGAAAVNEAGRLRMQTWRLVYLASQSDTERVQQQRAAFNASLALLRRGDPARPLFMPSDAKTRSAFAEVEGSWAQLNRGWGSAQPPESLAQDAERLVTDVDRLVSAVEAKLSLWTTVLSLFQFAIMALAIGGAVAMLYAGHLFVFNPLKRLHSALARMESGDWEVQVHIDTQDEFGSLGRGFNAMARTLKGFYRDLEAKVEAKTQDLRAEQQRLSLLYDASEFAGRTQNLEELAQGFVQQFRRALHADAAVLRWTDSGRQRFLLLAAEGLPEDMSDEERCLRAGDCHCGSEESQRFTRVIPIHAGTQPSACERNGFVALVTVPVRAHEQLLGEVDLLFRRAVRLDHEDRALLDSLAAHLATAMEGLRAHALEREAAVAEERSHLARELHDSIAQSLAFLRIQAQMLSQAQRQGDWQAAAAPLQELDVGLKECTADVRELLVHFRTRTNQEDIVPALRTTLQKFEKQSGMTSHLQVEGHGLPLDPDVQVQVLHVVQEALSNVRKHAQAREVWVEVQQEPQWRFEVRDDGEGFEHLPGADDTHVGLRIMRERAARIGARVEVASVPGQGTCVVLSLPRGEAIAA